MGDRCYMQVTCRRKDVEEFESIDFTMQDWNNENPDSPTVVMVDEEANHGHCDEMPTNIPLSRLQRTRRQLWRCCVCL